MNGLIMNPADMRMRTQSSRRPCPGLSGFLACVLLLFLVMAAPPATAQMPRGGTQLVLDDGGTYFDVGPAMYVTADPGRIISFRGMIERFTSGDRGEPHMNDIVALGGGGKPQWLVFMVRNDSLIENWVLHFGEHLDGRVGVLEDLLIYEHLSGTRYVDTITGQRNAGAAQQNLGTSVKVRIPRGGQAFFIIYAVPESGIPATIAPRLIAEDAFQAVQASPYKKQNLMNLYFVLMVGFFITALIFTQILSAGVFALYFVANFFLFHHGNSILYTGSALSNEGGMMIFALCVLTGLVIAKMFLEVTSVDRAALRLLVLVAGGVVIGTGLGVLLPGGGAFKAAAMLLPGFLGAGFIVMLSLAQALNGRYAARQFAMAWVAMLTGLVVSILALAGILKPGAVTLAGYWYGMIAQGFLFISAFSSAYFAQRYELAMLSATQEEEEESLAVLNKSRETSENMRLKRLIEHEREMMNEMREREVRNSEEMRKAKEYADEANRAKSAFLAVVSHEIRTPMTGIMGMVRLLLDTHLTADQQDYAQTIQDSGDAMLALLNDILDFEKIESGRMDLEYIDFDLNRVLNGVITLMSGHAARKNIALRAEIDPAIPRYVVGDPIRLRQVLLNLVGNSIKFTSEGGVTLRVSLAGPGTEKGGDTSARVRFAVVDTGIGITLEAQKNLFNPFSQADSTVARKFGGTGLGLAISQRLIGAMGGAINIDSTPGEGSTFYFTLQLNHGNADAVEHEPVPGSTQVKPQKAMNILVVEDNEINQKLLKEFIQRMGHAVTLAGTGEEGLARVEQADAAFDMVFMDIELPGMSGMGTTKAIRALADRARAATPVIALTGNVGGDMVQAMFAANMNGHVAKPVDPRALEKMIRKVVEDKLDNPVELPESVDHHEGLSFNRIPLPEDTAEAVLNADMEDEMLLDQEIHTPATIDGAVFDYRLLDSLKQNMPPIQMRSMIDGLVEKCDEIIERLEDPQIHMPDIIARAHELKGMAGNFGLTKISALASDIEKDARSAREEHTALPVSVYALIEQLRDDMGAAKHALYQWLES